MGSQDVTFQWRRDTAQAWAFKNPILLEGEPGLVLGTRNFKVGDSRTRWLDLEFFIPEFAADPEDGSTLAALIAHINSETPHPAYDDGPSLLLLYQNAKV